MFQGLRVKYSRVLYRYSKQQRAVIFVRFFLWDNSVCIDAKFQLIVTPRYLVITSGSLVWFEGRNLGSVTGISLVLAQCLKPFLQYPTTLVHLKCKSILANNNCKNTRRYGAVNSTVCTYSGHCLSLSINCFKFIRTLSTPARTLSISGLKSRVLKLPLFDLKMMVKSGLEFFVLKFTKPLQSCCCPVQKNMSKKAELAGRSAGISEGAR